jgi:DNA-directed RNA polymerase subunit RPC12/RpoP
MAKRRIEIPKGLKCPECNSADLIGRGTDWRVNPKGDKPPRVRVQLYRCNCCGKIFSNGEVKKYGGTS